MPTIDYASKVDEIDIDALTGFFVGWPNPPSPETLKNLLTKSDHALVALDGQKVVGYITALADGVLFSSITSIEVLPEYQGQGIGKELLQRMLKNLSDHYATDLVCDEDVTQFYERAGMIRLAGMGVRRRDRLTPS